MSLIRNHLLQLSMFSASDNKDKEPKEVKNDEEEDSGEDEDV